MVPGHKTEVKDGAWLAPLLEHGLWRASFIPPRPIRELRELTRCGQTLIQERASEINRVHKRWRLAEVLTERVTTHHGALLGSCWRIWSFWRPPLPG